jgi:hypothetical protein
MSEIFNPLRAFDEGAEHARLQRIATIAQLAHHWAKARRERLTFGPVRSQPCEKKPDEEAYEDVIQPNETCVDVIRDGDYLSPCHPCEETMARMLEKKQLASKLSGLSARLERACLGPREKKGASDV